MDHKTYVTQRTFLFVKTKGLIGDDDMTIITYHCDITEEDLEIIQEQFDDSVRWPPAGDISVVGKFEGKTNVLIRFKIF